MADNCDKIASMKVLKGPETPNRRGLISCRKMKHESFPTFFLNH